MQNARTVAFTAKNLRCDVIRSATEGESGVGLGDALLFRVEVGISHCNLVI